MAKKTPTEWIVRCDGLRVAKEATQAKAKAKAVAAAMGKQYPATMIFTVEPGNTRPGLK